MKNIYKIVWTDFALQELAETIKYLEHFYTSKELNHLAVEIEKTIALISNNPFLFVADENKNIHRKVVAKYNTLYYRIKEENIVEILSFFSNRQDPQKRSL